MAFSASFLEDGGRWKLNFQFIFWNKKGKHGSHLPKNTYKQIIIQSLHIIHTYTRYFLLFFCSRRKLRMSARKTFWTHFLSHLLFSVFFIAFRCAEVHLCALCAHGWLVPCTNYFWKLKFLNYCRVLFFFCIYRCKVGRTKKTFFFANKKRKKSEI